MGYSEPHSLAVGKGTNQLKTNFSSTRREKLELKIGWEKMGKSLQGSAWGSSAMGDRASSFFPIIH